MKKELTTEHLAAYFPYEVRCVYQTGNGIGEHMDVIESLYLSRPHSFGTTLWPMNDLDKCKLILRPISDLTREITHNGETFVPAERLDPVLRLVHNKYVNDWDAVGWMDVESWPYPLVKQLHSWHFDTFGLIEACLAEPIP